MSAGGLLGLGAAVAWGSGDFLGGWNARRLPPTTVAFWAQSSSLLILLALLVAVRPGWNNAAFGWGLAAGLFTGFGGAHALRAGLARRGERLRGLLAGGIDGDDTEVRAASGAHAGDGA